MPEVLCIGITKMVTSKTTGSITLWYYATIAIVEFMEVYWNMIQEPGQHKLFLFEKSILNFHIWVYCKRCKRILQESKAFKDDTQLNVYYCVDCMKMEGLNMVTLAEIKAANVQWFDKGNKAFFQDVRYWILHDNEGMPYLLRLTYQWSDMFGQAKKLVYKVNPIDPDTLRIKPLLDVTFKTRQQAKDYIKC